MAMARVMTVTIALAKRIVKAEVVITNGYGNEGGGGSVNDNAFISPKVHMNPNRLHNFTSARLRFNVSK